MITGFYSLCLRKYRFMIELGHIFSCCQLPWMRTLGICSELCAFKSAHRSMISWKSSGNLEIRVRQITSFPKNETNICKGESPEFPAQVRLKQEWDAGSLHLCCLLDWTTLTSTEYLFQSGWPSAGHCAQNQQGQWPLISKWRGKRTRSTVKEQPLGQPAKVIFDFGLEEFKQ